MKKVLLTLAAATLSLLGANATEITIDITSIPAADIVGTHIEENLTGEQNVYEQWNPLESFTAEGYTFTFAQNGSATAPAIYSSASGARTLRIYKGKTADGVTAQGNTMTITAPEGTTFEKVIFNNSDNKGVVNVDKGTAQSIEKTIVWTGEATSTLTYEVIANFRINSIVICTSAGDGPVIEAPILSADFLQGQGEWTIDNVLMPEDLNYVWSADTRYGMKASAYYNNTSYTTEAWLISPVFDLTGYTATVMEFSQATNKFASVEAAAEQVTVWARCDGGEWQQLQIENFPTSLSWNFVDSTVDLAAVEGNKNVQVAFKYVSDAESCGTWEIKTVKIDGKKSSGISAAAASFGVSVIGNSIIAPADAQVYSLNGARVGTENLNKGVYIVRHGNKAVKVLVK